MLFLCCYLELMVPKCHSDSLVPVRNRTSFEGLKKNFFFFKSLSRQTTFLNNMSRSCWLSPSGKETCGGMKEMADTAISRCHNFDREAQKLRGTFGIKNFEVFLFSCLPDLSWLRATLVASTLFHTHPQWLKYDFNWGFKRWFKIFRSSQLLT